MSKQGSADKLRVDDDLQERSVI